MKRGFYTIMLAQFFSSLADNGLFVAAVELLKADHGAEWTRAALVPMFALFYVILAPFVGALADSRPKGQIMLVSNFVKVVGCLLMLFGHYPIFAYAVVGLGAAAYSPAKYGLLTELLPNSQLVKANGWIEGLTIASIILGIVIGGQLLGGRVSSFLLSFDIPWFETPIDTPAEAAICVLILIYAIAAWFNLRIPKTDIALRPFKQNPGHNHFTNLLTLVEDFWVCNIRLWKDKLGQISLSTTTLFWGVSGNLRYIVLAWSAVALSYSNIQASSSLVGVVAIGTAIGAFLASIKSRLDQATKVIPLGIFMGILLLGMNFITNVWVAIPFLIFLGGLGGYMVVPMNALLQHRGHHLMGAGRSIAVQNFNEQVCILTLGGLYALSTSLGLSAFGAIGCFGSLVTLMMYLIYRWHAFNRKHHHAELEILIYSTQHDD
jgi:MFS family permease